MLSADLPFMFTYVQFINTVGGSNLIASDSLSSVTEKIDLGNPFVLDGRIVILIDTPGFDDTAKSEREILEIIASYLENQ